MATPSRPTVRLLACAALAVLVAGASGCAPPARNPFVAPSAAESQVTVVVENRGFNDIRVYAITARGARSLGSVGGNTQRRVALEWRQIDQISFRIEVLAGRTYNTRGVAVSPGDRVDLVVPNDPNSSYIQVR